MHPQDNTVKLQSGTAVVALKCAAEGFPPPVIIWLRNNSTVVNDSVTSNGNVSTLILVLRTIKEEDPKYMCVATNAMGRTYSSEAALTFAEKPTTKSLSTLKGNKIKYVPSFQRGFKVCYIEHSFDNKPTAFVSAVHPDDHTQPTYEMTPGFKPFTVANRLRI